MTRTTRIVPAILTDDVAMLKAMVKQVESFTDYVQIDIMDGLFVPSKSIMAKDIAAIPIQIPWEAHLMIRKPQDCFDSFKKAGARRIIFHYEATPSPQSVIDYGRNLGLEIGLAINPETKVDSFRSLINLVDTVLFLTVNPGFYGSKFIPGVLDKIQELRCHHPDIEIGVDGGIKKENLVQVAQAGVDTICVGSAIFLQPRPTHAYQELVSLLPK
jgi:ribulose-phosphate 3-epimerase